MEGNSPEHGTAQRPEAGASSEHETGERHHVCVCVSPLGDNKGNPAFAI